MQYEIMNRGGALFVDHMQYETLPQLASARELLEATGVHSVCGAPFVFLFIGYDGQYYLCCSDWKKEVADGERLRRVVHDVSPAKLAARSRPASRCARRATSIR